MRSIGRNLNEAYRATPDAVGQARRRLSEFAIAAGAPPDQAQAIRLATSEAVSNAVLHAYGDEPGWVYVNAAVVAGELWILISDDGCGLQPRADRPGLGLGLGLISQVSDDFAVVTRSSGGTEVRIRFTLVAATPDGGGSTREPTQQGDRRSASGEPRTSGFRPSMSVA